MNKKLLKVITPVALMAVVGTGFSAWVFNKTATNSTDALTVTIGTATEGGAIQINNASTATFTIEQGTTIAKNLLATDVGDGVTTYDNGLSFKWGSLNADYYNDGNKRDDKGEESASQSITRKYEVSLDDALKQYFEIKKGGEGKWTDNTIIGTGVDGDACGSTLVLDWVEGKKPQNMTQYKAMKKVLTGSEDGTSVTAKITVKFTATVSDNQ